MKTLPTLAALAAVCASVAPIAAAQTPTAPTQVAPAKAAAAYTPPRTSTGQPSFEGIWTQNFVILLEASPQIPMLSVPEAQAKAIAAQVANGIGGGFEKGLDPEVPELMKTTDGFPIVQGERRTRSVVLPADGKLPYTEAARKESRRGYGSGDGYNNPEERPNWERCITGLGLPPVTGMYTTSANPLHIIQTRDAIIVHTEYGDEARIIPFAAAHRPKELWPLLGDSIARWEGDTLVVETIGMPEKDRVRVFSNLIVPSSAKVTERYTRVSDKELLYQYTVEDPATFSAPWLAEYSLYATDQRMFEHACHEGNYSLPNILSAARVKDARTAAKPPG